MTALNSAPESRNEVAPPSHSVERIVNVGFVFECLCKSDTKVFHLVGEVDAGVMYG